MRPMEYNRFIALLIIVFSFVNCNNEVTEVLKPGDFLTSPGIINPGREFGHLGTINVNVPASTDIFLSGAEEDVEIINYPDERVDRVPDNTPVKVLEGTIFGGETLDIYATGKARLQRIEVGPNGGDRIIEAGPALRVRSIEAPVGALVGMFSNQKQPFIIGRRKKIVVPRGARFLSLAVLDYPGASSNNQLGFDVTIDAIRR